MTSDDRETLLYKCRKKPNYYYLRSVIMAAISYQQSSATVQLEGGKTYIDKDVLPQPGDAILDLGCGTGELSTYLAELVGPHGYVIGVDPDSNRLNLAKETHRHVKNLFFVEGNSDDFEGIGSEKYDLIFSNCVFHWIPDKDRAFRNMFNSLKVGGKIAIHYMDAQLPFITTSFELLNPETAEKFNKMFDFEIRDNIDRMCRSAGFNVVSSYYAYDKTVVYPSVESLLQWLVGTSHGVFDLQLVTQERIQQLLEKLGNPPFDFTANSRVSKLFAVKPVYRTQ